MMKLKTRNKLLIVAVIIILQTMGCQSQKDLQMSLPGEDISIEDVNSQLRLSAPEGWNTFQIGQGIGVAIENTSDHPIAVDCTQPRVFLYQEEQWVEIDNLSECMGEPIDIVPPTENDYLEIGSVGVLPDLPDPSQAVALRILVVGNIVQNGVVTEEQTAAFIDIILNP